MKRTIFGAFAVSAISVFITLIADARVPNVKVEPTSQAAELPIIRRIRERRAQFEIADPNLEIQLPPAVPVKGRGYVPPTPAVKAARHAAASARHGQNIASLPKVLAPKFDCRDMGWVPPVKDQGDCGSCYQFSGAEACAAAYYKAGYKDKIGVGFAEQYGMDCHKWGGCNGGDEYDIIAWAKSDGLPTEADYGSYTAQSGSCKLKPGTKLWKIDDFGYATGDQSDRFPTYQELKNAVATYGAISVAGSANGWDSYTGGLFKDHGGQVDHAYLMIGWDDTASPKGAILVQNQWSDQWGNRGTMLAEYGANSIGTEPIWTVIHPAIPPTPPTPPTPPVGGDIVITVPAGTPSGSYTVGVSSGLTATEKAELARLVAKITGDTPEPSSRVPIFPPSRWTRDVDVAAQLGKAMEKQGSDAVQAYKAVANNEDPTAHPMLMRMVWRKMRADPEGRKILAEYTRIAAENDSGETGPLPPGFLQNLLDWLVKNGPAILNFVMMIMKLFGL